MAKTHFLRTGYKRDTFFACVEATANGDKRAPKSGYSIVKVFYNQSDALEYIHDHNTFTPVQ